MYIPLGSEQLRLTKAGLSALEIVLDPLQLRVCLNGKPGSAIKWLPGQTLAVLPGYLLGVGLNGVPGLGLASCHLPCILASGHFFMCHLELYFRKPASESSPEERGGVLLLLSFHMFTA